ncbi:L domain-like protein [Sistotremastrum niveocremeum HHB9708]|uniref:L domain-like protein n=1 Tax=Sistotremastrum niveocremeum HHB9708 TaxID=1314777 RepID=A0A164ZPM2_9AGAM|nr:L domain-like protein [Sistotremastrum niveocremeum HHB9708]
MSPSVLAFVAISLLGTHTLAAPPTYHNQSSSYLSSRHHRVDHDAGSSSSSAPAIVVDALPLAEITLKRRAQSDAFSHHARDYPSLVERSFHRDVFHNSKARRSGNSNPPNSDCKSLAHLFNVTSGHSWTVKDGWSSNGASGCCSWYGVECSSSGQISALNLANNGLKGRFPESILNITTLENLNLSLNALKGPLPNQWQNMNSLSTLDLSHNPIGGSVPQSLASSPIITNLHLSNDSLSGPADFSSAKKLQNVFLNENRLSSLSPPRSGASLQRLIANDNQLSGELPDLRSFPELLIVNFAGNQLSGNLFDLNTFTNMSRFDVRSNELTGNIPDLASLTLRNLRVLSLSNNSFSGSFISRTSALAPDSLSTCDIVPQSPKFQLPCSDVNQPQNSWVARCGIPEACKNSNASSGNHKNHKKAQLIAREVNSRASPLYGIYSIGMGYNMLFSLLTFSVLCTLVCLL